MRDNRNILSRPVRSKCGTGMNPTNQAKEMERFPEYAKRPQEYPTEAARTD